MKSCSCCLMLLAIESSPCSVSSSTFVPGLLVSSTISLLGDTINSLWCSHWLEQLKRAVQVYIYTNIVFYFPNPLGTLTRLPLPSAAYYFYFNCGWCAKSTHGPPSYFNSIQDKIICSAALHTSGAAGIYTREWRRLCCSLKSVSDAIPWRFSPSDSVRNLWIQMACHLVALDKQSGVCPIGICEVVRRIIAKPFLFVASKDIQNAAGSLQTCTGHKYGTEAAVHAMNIQEQRMRSSVFSWCKQCLQCFKSSGWLWEISVSFAHQ